jgi:hypothetical protein
VAAVADVVTRLSRAGLRRGLFEGSRGWLYIGLAATGVRVLRRVLSEREVVERFELAPGEAVEIRTVRRG